MEFNKVIHGDCLSALSDLYDAHGEFADLFVTSPPYTEQRKNAYGGVPEKEYPDWMSSVVRAAMKVLKPTGSFILNIKEHAASGVRSTYVLETILLIAKEYRWVEEYIWHKTNPFPSGNKRRLKDGYERCVHFAKSRNFQFFPENVLEKSTSKWAGDNERRKNKGAHHTKNGSGMDMSKRITGDMVRPSNVITMPGSCLNLGHPATFPIALPEFFIKLMTKPGNIVVDPFLGSGTTALASLKLGRQYVGIERSEEYMRLATERLEKERISLQ